jgi:hypothetical protein
MPASTSTGNAASAMRAIRCTRSVRAMVARSAALVGT